MLKKLSFILDSMKRINAINWDVDKVWYKDISTTYCAEASPLDPKPYLDGFLKEGWFSRDDVKKWADYVGKDPNEPIKTVGDMARCLTDFLYRIKTDDGDSIITKEQTIKGKQSLLKDLSMRQIREIAGNVELTPGLRDAVNEFRATGMYQAAFSDGLGPFIAYIANREGMEYWGIVPAIVESGGEIMPFDNSMIEMDGVFLTGRTEKFNKSDAFFNHMKDKGYPLSSIAAIDDSGANVETLKAIQEEGGVAIGFNPTDAHEPKFREAGIPILKQTERSLEPFREIVLNPSEETIRNYCI